MTRNMFLSRVLMGLGLIVGLSSGAFAQGIDEEDDQFATLLAKVYIGAVKLGGANQLYSAIWFDATTPLPTVTGTTNYTEKTFNIKQTGHEAHDIRVGVWNNSFNVVNGLKIQIAAKVAATAHTKSTAWITLGDASVIASTGSGGVPSSSMDAVIPELIPGQKTYLSGSYDLEIVKTSNTEESPI